MPGPGAFYTVRGITAATVGTIDHCAFAIWNPSAGKRIELLEWGVFCTTAPVATSGLYMRRITARGTPGSTATPSLENALQRDALPDSGFLLDLAAYSVQPTLAAAPGMKGWVPSAAVGAGIVLPVRDIIIPPGTGIAWLNRAAAIFPVSEVYCVVAD
jgi:hypothetical protein